MFCKGAREVRGHAVMQVRDLLLLVTNWRRQLDASMTHSMYHWLYPWRRDSCTIAFKNLYHKLVVGGSSSRLQIFCTTEDDAKQRCWDHVCFNNLSSHALITNVFGTILVYQLSKDLKCPLIPLLSRPPPHLPPPPAGEAQHVP